MSLYLQLIQVPCHRHTHIYKLYDKATPKQAPVALFLYLVLYSFMEKKHNEKLLMFSFTPFGFLARSKSEEIRTKLTSTRRKSVTSLCVLDGEFVESSDPPELVQLLKSGR